MLDLNYTTANKFDSFREMNLKWQRQKLTSSSIDNIPTFIKIYSA